MYVYYMYDDNSYMICDGMDDDKSVDFSKDHQQHGEPLALAYPTK